MSQVSRGPPTLPRELFCQFAQAAEAVCSQLTEDARQHLRQLLGLGVPRDSEGVGGQRGLDFGVVEVDHGPVVLDHIHLKEDEHLHTQDQMHAQKEVYYCVQSIFRQW